MKTKNVYLLVITIIGLLSMALYTTYAMFTASIDTGNIVNMKSSNLPTETNLIESKQIVLEPTESKIVEFNINNDTNNVKYYGAWYRMISPSAKSSDIVIARFDETDNSTFGSLASDESITVTLLLENGTQDTIIINIGVAYSDTSSLNLPESYTLITDVEGKTKDLSNYHPQGTVEYDYNANEQIRTFVANETGDYKLEVWGAQGGSYNESYGVGGKGGYSYGTITLNKNDTLYVYVGEKGTHGQTATYTTAANAVFNGGAAVGYGGGTGGGATDIRFVMNSDPLNSTSLLSRVIVAGGGGGAYSYNSTYKADGGVGGGISGAEGGYYDLNYADFTGKGASQTSGGAGGTASTTAYNGDAGSFGLGGQTGYKYNSTSYFSNGSGGGGWYGGGGAGNFNSSTNNRTRAAGGGGGSGFVWTGATSSNVPSGYSVSSSYYLKDAQTIAGDQSFTSPTGTSETGHSGNGYARITHISTLPSLTGINSITVGVGTSYDLLEGVTCVDNGDGCTILSVSISDTSVLSLGKYTVTYKAKDNNNIKYKFTRELIIDYPKTNETIINLSQGDSWESGASGVYATNAYDDNGVTKYHEYRYIGANVNNYVKYNDDMYRIIGVFDENSHGVEGQYLVKLIAANPLTGMSWGAVNAASAYTTYSTYNNNWVTASTNIMLNEYWLNANNTSSTYGSCENWTYYSSNNNYKTKDCSNVVGYGIQTENLKNYIQPVTWYLTGLSTNDANKQTFYTCERSDTLEMTGCGVGDSDSYPTKVENTYVGLMYVSDYMYASGYFSSTDTTRGQSLYFGQQNWLLKGPEWTITPRYRYDNLAFCIDYRLLTDYTSSSYSIRPVFYLKSSIAIISGNGTFNNPYILK